MASTPVYSVTSRFKASLGGLLARESHWQHARASFPDTWTCLAPPSGDSYVVDR